MPNPYWTLSPYERQVFDMLFARAGRIVEHDEFAAAGFNKNSACALIKRIRRKIPQVTIITAKGWGYRYIPGRVPNPPKEGG